MDFLYCSTSDSSSLPCKPAVLSASDLLQIGRNENAVPRNDSGVPPFHAAAGSPSGSEHFAFGRQCLPPFKIRGDYYANFAQVKEEIQSDINDELQRRFSIPGVVTVEAGQGGLTRASP